MKKLKKKTQNLELWRNLKKNYVDKLKNFILKKYLQNSNGDETQKSSCDKTLIWNLDPTKLKFWQNLKTEFATKLKDSNFAYSKTQNSKCDKTPIATQFKNSNRNKTNKKNHILIEFKN